MSFRDPNAFSDSEDSQLVKDAKKEVTEPVLYSYTEVRFCDRMSTI